MGLGFSLDEGPSVETFSIQKSRVFSIGGSFLSLINTVIITYISSLCFFFFSRTHSFLQ
jgi:hypothetical protein